MKAQTTFLDIQLDDGSGCTIKTRITYKHPLERSRLSGSFGRLEVHTSHPLLWDHVEPWSRVCLGSGPIDPVAFLSDLDRIIVECSLGWRAAEDYLNDYFEQDHLRLHHDAMGVLMIAPMSIISATQELLESQLRSLSILPDKQPGAETAQAITMDRMYVVARHFSFTPAIIPP